MKLIFFNNVNVDSAHSSIENDTIFSLSAKLMGRHLIMRNIATLNTVYDIKSIEIPADLYLLNNLIHQHFPSIDVTLTQTIDTFQETINHNSHSRNASLGSDLTRLKGPTSSIRIPSNSILHINAEGELVIDEINYPWDFLKSVQKILDMEVTSTKVSSKAKISKTSILEGPCIIEKGVVIDDFCKIKGACIYW